MKPHQRSPQFFVTLRLLEVLTTNTPGSGLGSFLPQTGALVFPPCSQTLPCCEMLPRSTFACFPSCCSLPIPGGMCPVPACPGSLGCHEPPGRFMTSKEGGCCCSSWGKCVLGGRGRLGEGGCDIKWGLSWAGLGWTGLGWALGIWNRGSAPACALTADRSLRAGRSSWLLLHSAPAQHFLFLYNCRNVSFFSPRVSAVFTPEVKCSSSGLQPCSQPGMHLFFYYFFPLFSFLSCFRLCKPRA